MSCGWPAISVGLLRGRSVEARLPSVIQLVRVTSLLDPLPKDASVQGSEADIVHFVNLLAAEPTVP